MSLPDGYETTFPTVGHTWLPVDLVAAAANPPEPPCIGGLLYPGKRTLLSGETESLKTWLGLILAKAELDAGYPVGWVDLDAMGGGEILDRLRLLGVPDEQISARFLFYEPEQRLADDALTDVIAEVTERNVRLFVIDAFNSMLSLHGLDPNSTPDVEAYWRGVAKPICDAGPAAVHLDHVVKNADSRGKYAYGSERKASGANVHIGFKPLESFARGRAGRTLLTTHKDRAGFLPRPTIGVLELVSDDETVTYTLEPDRSRAGDGFRPTFLMQRVSEYLATCDGPVSRNDIENSVKGKRDAIRTAIDVLVEEGFARESEGPRRSRLIEFVRSYRDEDEPVEPDDSTSPRLRPDFAPTLVSTPSSDFAPPPPYRGEGRSQEASSPLASPPVRPVGAEGLSGNGRIPISGDPDFPDWIDQKFQDCHLTESEWLERRKLHALVVAGAA